MKVYIKTKPYGKFDNDNFFKAYLGFHEMGFEVVTFSNNEEMRTSNPEDVIVGYVETVRRRLNDFGIRPPEIDYPSEIMNYVGRKIWKSTINTINSNPDLWPVFVKPVEDKMFTGVAVRSTRDLIGCGRWNGDSDVLCSEIVNFIAEWRVFVRYNHIIDVRLYKGDWRVHYDPNIIDRCIAEYTSAPNGYAADFGLTDDGRTLLIEINDGYALGNYGLISIEYAKLLSARWAELTGTKDDCSFNYSNIF